MEDEDDRTEPVSLPMSGVEKRSLRSLAEQPFAVLFRNEVEAVSDEADRRFVGVHSLNLIWRIAGPHQTLWSKGLKQTLDHRNQFIMRRLLLAERIECRNLDARVFVTS